MCGEKQPYIWVYPRKGGSPPRVRGKVLFLLLYILAFGITPACAGKSNRRNRIGYDKRDHPRVCGEKREADSKLLALQGSPPRVRGKGFRTMPMQIRAGITPACAGKSQHWKAKFPGIQDHPRVCGEKGKCPRLINLKPGSPPRVRGKD